MKVKFMAIIDMDLQLEAVKQNGCVLQHVLNFEVFKRIAETLSIEVDN